ncbi:hypothetical protein BT93_H2231 [Corymbia citriodora subsp. variegata]|nr:hypothetical protein BT93_H2231 [Corymbia citriodora subsp. variegata]
MSKEEFTKIQTWVLKVYMHCDGCERDVTKALKKIKGVLTVKIDRDQNKVTVSGTAASDLLTKKLKGIGKPAELLAPQKSSKSNPDPPFKDIHIDDGKGGTKDQKGGGGSGLLYLMAP